jgi:serine O-acetyltransferase
MMAPNDENLEIVSAFADNSQLSPVTLQDESEEHRQQRLKNAVDGLLASYGKYPEIERIGTTPLPSKENIVRLLEGIQVLLFPGLIRQERFDSLNLPYAMGQRTTTVFEQLQEYIEEVLCWEYSQGGEDCHQREDFRDQVEGIVFEFLEYLPELRGILAEDVDAIFAGDPAATSKREIVLAYPGLQALSVYRIAHFLHNHGVPLIPRIMTEHVHSRFGIDIHPNARLGQGIMLDHGTAVVIGATTTIGDNVRMYQGITLGALSPKKHKGHPLDKRHPTIEDNVIIYSGATILGGDTVIGAGSIIGGNVWLTHSVPPNSRVYLKDPSLQQEVRERKAFA